jgi:hypothetical protein
MVHLPNSGCQKSIFIELEINQCPRMELGLPTKIRQTTCVVMTWNYITMHYEYPNATAIAETEWPREQEH